MQNFSQFWCFQVVSVACKASGVSTLLKLLCSEETGKATCGHDKRSRGCSSVALYSSSEYCLCTARYLSRLNLSCLYYGLRNFVQSTAMAAFADCSHLLHVCFILVTLLHLCLYCLRKISFCVSTYVSIYSCLLVYCMPLVEQRSVQINFSTCSYQISISIKSCMASFATKLVSLVIEDSENERIWVEWLRESELCSGTCTFEQYCCYNRDAGP